MTDVEIDKQPSQGPLRAEADRLLGLPLPEGRTGYPPGIEELPAFQRFRHRHGVFTDSQGTVLALDVLGDGVTLETVRCTRNYAGAQVIRMDPQDGIITNDVQGDIPPIRSEQLLAFMGAVTERIG